MNNNKEKYLPIGTVVMLKGGSKRVMITGFCLVSNDDTNTIYDYVGCLYPEGFLSNDESALFNHNQISQIYHMGLVDQEELIFKNQLKNLINKVSSVVPSPQTAPVQQPMEQPVPPIGPGLPGYVPLVQNVGTQTNINNTTIPQQ